MNEKKTALKSTIDVYTDVENAICNLSTLPSILQLIIDGFNLDGSNTPDDIELTARALDFYARREDMYNSIYLVRNVIYDTVKELRSIKLEADLDDEEV